MDYRFNDRRSDVKFGVAVIPRINLYYAISQDFEIGSGFATKILYNGDYYALSFIASLNISFGFRPSVEVHERQHLEEELEKIITKSEEKLTLKKVSDKELRLNISEILFSFRSAELSESVRKMLKSVAEEIRDYKGIYLLIEGHTDNVGDDKVNLLLSESRARNVANLFIECGFSTDRVFYKGYGKSRPLVPNDSDENRALNRRVEIRIIWK